MKITRISGRVVERSTVCVPVQTKERPRRAKTKGGTTAIKQDENERNCEKRLARIINCNFRPGDVLLTASYSAEGWAELEEKAAKLEDKHPEDSWEDRMVMAAESDGANWIRRMQRGKKGAGGTALLRYVMVASDMDGKTGEPKRVHIHALFPFWALPLAMETWTAGMVNIRHLREQDDYTPIAKYLLRQVRRRAKAQKYRVARGMDKPQVLVEEVPGNVPLKPRKNEVIMHQAAIEPGTPQYLRTVNLGRKRPERKEKGKLPDLGEEKKQYARTGKRGKTT